MSRRAAVAPALALALTLLPGCAQVPLHGPVVAGPTAGANGGGSVRIQAQAPQPGASQEEVAQGYLDAMSTYEVGFALAKLFLTDAAKDAWVQSPIVIYDRPVVEVAADATVHFGGRRVAEIDASGQYTAASPEAPFDIALPMVKDGGEWLISEPPPGLFITTLAQLNDYSSYVAYYPSRSADVLVPDVVWLPGSGPALATVLVQALVDGPTSRLGEAVVNAFPEGTTVTAVTIRSGNVASVALSRHVAAASPADQQAMAAQLAYTLQGVPVRAVAMTVAGEPFDVPGVVDVFGPSVFPDRDPLLGFRTPDAYALMSDRLMRLDPATGAAAQVPGVLLDSAAGARSLAVDLGESLVAVVSANGRSVSTFPLAGGEEPPAQGFTGIDIAAPSWDRFGDLWVVDRTSPGRSTVYVIAPDGTGGEAKIDAPALEGVEVQSLRVAPDGARLAAAVRLEDATTRLLFLRIVRAAPDSDQDPVPDQPRVVLTGVADPPIQPGLESIGDVAWVSGTDVAVVLSGATRAQAAVMRVDGSLLRPEVETGVRAVAAYAEQPLFAVTREGVVRRKVSAITWETVGPGVAVTYPG